MKDAFGSGMAALTAGNPAEALSWFDKALRKNPRHWEAAANGAVAAHQAGQSGHAARLISLAITHQPANPDLWYWQFIIAHTAQAWPLAEDALEKARGLRPGHEPFEAARITLLNQLGRLDEAIAQGRALTAAQPGSAAGWAGLATALQAARQMPEAEQAFRRALGLSAADPGVMKNFAILLNEQERYGEAESLLRRALALGPGRPDLLAAQVTSLMGLDRLDDADRAIRAASARTAELCHAAGRLAERRAQHSLAEAAYDQALALSPGFTSSRYGRGIARLCQGKIGPGWDDYEDRFHALIAFPPYFVGAKAVWDGADLSGRSLLIWGEQGVGDLFLFSSMIPDVLRTQPDARILLAVDPRMVTLFQRSFPGITVLPIPPAGSPAIATDTHIPMGSLGRLFRRSLNDFPAYGATETVRQPGVLVPDPARVARYKTQLAGLGDPPYVGITWRSLFLHGGRQQFYFKPSDWAGLDRSGLGTMISLQYGIETGEIEGQPVSAIASLDLKDDFDGVAALLQNLDLVISADTAMAPFAAACGVPTLWLTLQGRWAMLGTDNHYWFPGITTLTKMEADPWPPVLETAFSLAALQIKKASSAATSV